MDRIDAVLLLRSLEGQIIPTLTGRPNRILRLEGDDTVLATNKSPEGRPVPITWVQSALDRLATDGTVEISVESVGYRSAFIGAVLSTVQGVVVGPGVVRLPARR